MRRAVFKCLIACFAALIVFQSLAWILSPRGDDGANPRMGMVNLPRAFANDPPVPTNTFTRTYTPTWTFTPTKTSTPTNTSTPTPLPTPQAIYQHTDGEPSEIEPDEDIDGVAQGHPFWVYVKGVPDKPNDYTFYRKMDPGGYVSLSPTLNYYSNPLNGFYFSQPNNLSPGHYYYKVAVQSANQTDEDGAEVWRGGIAVQTNTPTRTFTPTYTYTKTFTPTPLPTPQAIYQREELDMLPYPNLDIDGIAEGNDFVVYIYDVPENAAYDFYRKEGQGAWQDISQTPSYDLWDLHGYYFTEPDTISPGHYYYKVTVQNSTRSDEDGGDVWRGGIVVQTNTPTPTQTYTPSLTFTPVPKTIYVDLDATGGNDGTSWTDAFTSIGAALDDAWIGDEIWVAEGTYSSTIALVANVSLYGGFAATETLRTQRDWVQHVTTIDGNGAASTVTAANDTVLNGFAIMGGSGTKGGGLAASSVDNLDISNCIIKDNAATDGGACGFSDSDATLTNCLLYGNSSTDDGGTVYIEGDSEVTLMNCTLADNSATGDTNGIYLESYTSDCIVTNSIVWNGGDELEQGSGVITMTYSCVTGGFWGTGNISSDPDFYDAQNGDYRLFSGSGCIDSATSLVAPDQDIRGVARPQDSGYDMGAYEGSIIPPTPMPTATPTISPTPLPTPAAIFQTADTDIYNQPSADIDIRAVGNEYTVYIYQVPENASYKILRKPSTGSWTQIFPSLNYDRWEIEGYYFIEPNTLSATHYYYKVSSPGASASAELTDEDGAEVWRGGIVVATRTPTITATFTPTPTPTTEPKLVLSGGLDGRASHGSGQSPGEAGPVLAEGISDSQNGNIPAR